MPHESRPLVSWLIFDVGLYSIEPLFVHPRACEFGRQRGRAVKSARDAVLVVRQALRMLSQKGSGIAPVSTRRRKTRVSCRFLMSGDWIFVPFRSGFCVRVCSGHLRRPIRQTSLLQSNTLAACESAWPNKAPEPTPRSVTPRAVSRSIEMKHRNPTRHTARVAPARVVAHL